MSASAKKTPMSAINQKKHLAGFTMLIYTRVPTAVYRRGTAPYLIKMKTFHLMTMCKSASIFNLTENIGYH